MRLRYKMMAALLATGLGSVALVGGVAYVSVNYKVDSLRRQQAAEHFHTYMTAYLAEYGDWQSAIATESFDRFVRRQEGERQSGAELPSEMLERMPPRLNNQARNAPPREGVYVPRQGGGPPPDPTLPAARRSSGTPPPDGGFPPADYRDAPPDPTLPAVRHRARTPDMEADRPPPPRREGPPPFRFILTDAGYRVLLGGGQFRYGEALPENLRASARAIVVKNQTVAYMSSEGTLAATPQEQKYLAALYNSLLWGIAAAAGLATLLGVLLSRGLSRSLSGLTGAVKRMQQGELRQEVAVQGRDEVAALATAFNAMSAQLAQSHEELNTSHATILEQAEQLRELSIRDALTQLYNRRHFDEQANSLFNQAVRHKRPLALVICDIDHFKKINDTYSHATGDTVLRHVGSILRKHMRLSDLVARYGGEEFVMAFPETAGPQAVALCDKLRTLIESFPWHEVHPGLKVTMSMGVYADIAAGSAETMLRKADALLYRAKESGRNRVCFLPSTEV
ncbi:diguanylate cyclase (GGDEF) domain-containing protein [Duganella sp. CF458]|uniref:diguanylate cyclase n=1 Tax=Duganella sp. CF458 TaxID=1884368 RepID=UPI0008EFEE0F|nr:diguanylate cyclase [Duganella sp. CF458]SFG40001.1 diguanylate cyclase (GGDEF) domain-containing protein [Duganella sp. CF458]